MGLKILLAEANVAAQNAGRKILASGGHDVVAVSNGLAAMKKISEAHPDIVLLDVYMAGVTGVEVCKKVRATADLAHTPVLLTVGKMDPFGAGEAIKSKADGLITKPFDVANLITVVEKLAGFRRPPGSMSAQETQTSNTAALAHTRSEVELAQRRQGGELCDVCGHVNREDSLVCEKCDVPLPSSVKAHQ